MKNIHENTTIRDIVVAFPQTRRVFERLGLDYCCGGQTEIKVAVEQAGFEYETVLAHLEKAACERNETTPSEQNWQEAPVADLVDHIFSVHHAFLRRQFPRINGLLDTVISAHKPHAEMLQSLQRVYIGLRDEIENHLMKEEMILFPYIRQLDDMSAGRQSFVPMHCGSVANPIGQMEYEHTSAGEALAKLHALSSDYTLPTDACPTFAELYQSLRDLEADLHEHIHLENNILFPRAIEVERTLAASSR